MSDTIERQAAIAELEKDKASIDRIIKKMSGYEKEFGVLVSQRKQVEYDINAINGLPSVPAAPIQCKDCKHSHMTIDGELCKYCDQFDYEGELMEMYFDADFFCGFAERRETDG